MVQRDIALLFATRCIRMFGYGLLAVVLVLYLDAVGLSGGEIGLLLALTLLGDAAISLWLTTHADRIGRRRVLIAGAVLLLAGGLAFVATPVFAVLLVAATIGVISPSGNEVGPFLAVEQASLTQLVDPKRRTHLFTRYQLAGSLSTAFGALAAGTVVAVAAGRVMDAADAYRVVIIGYALVGVVLAVLFARVSPAVEVPPSEVVDPTIRTRLGLHTVTRRGDAAVGPVRPGCVRGRVRDAELHHLLVQRALRRGAGGAGRDHVRRQHHGGGFGARRRCRWLLATASSGRWCSPTCRRTSC